ncbi:hypothetical protein G6F24_015415 [Rhizopus arrhizus]|nr:hypothetical protein G6F24_015415 [Rhizopus arrhizus]
MALVFGIVFLVSGLAFKLGAVPFHMWVPDVYQGSPTAVTLILGGAPKLAAFAITLRLLVDGLLARRGYIDSASADAGIRRVSPDHSSQVLGIFGPQVNIEAWLRRWMGRPGVPAALKIIGGDRAGIQRPAQPAGLHQSDGRRHFAGTEQIVGGHQDRRAAVTLAHDQLMELGRSGRVQAGRRAMPTFWRMPLE